MNDKSIYNYTTNSIWICLIENRILVGQGSRTKGKCAWVRKCDVARVFKESVYWKNIVSKIESNYSDLNHKNKSLKTKLNDEYLYLLKKGIVKYIEIKQVPDWVNI